ncbi:hypothetical protein ES288_D08G229500v1 [Gossypium darwinii]|uniref:Uncharacterized protein n=3 Tax=Gossypium TaxID=3633 RepID=A0A5D2BPL7_GOSDA|nr:hypothetical protein ES288_D08G229500v1 [Gossypium darwinii]
MAYPRCEDLLGYDLKPTTDLLVSSPPITDSVLKETITTKTLTTLPSSTFSPQKIVTFIVALDQNGLPSLFVSPDGLITAMAYRLPHVASFAKPQDSAARANSGSQASNAPQLGSKTVSRGLNSSLKLLMSNCSFFYSLTAFTVACAFECLGLE